MTVKRTTRRYKHIEKALGQLVIIERAQQHVDHLKVLIGETPCAVCGQQTELDNFCFGCLDFICTTCQPVGPDDVVVAGPHTLDGHKEMAAQLVGSQMDTKAT